MTQDMKEELRAHALKMRERAYAPHSHFHVGAAVLGDNGKIYGGCNIENTVYSLTMCAERTAIFSAVADGAKRIAAIYVVADTEEPVSACGACRQVMAEFSIEKIILANVKGEEREATIGELLPGHFSLESL